MTIATVQTTPDIMPAEIRAVAKQAYIYGYPMVENYRVQYSYFVDRKDAEYKAPYNRLFSVARVFTPEDKAIQTPNSDTPYSLIGLDLRTEPIVFTVPPIEKDRYWNLQFIDLYTHNFDYLGTRSTGNDGGSFLLAGPNWNSAAPEGIKRVIRSETELAFAQFRTQLFNPEDLENVKKIQDQYKVQTLSAFLKQPAPKAAPAIEFIKPLTKEAEKTSLDFFKEMNFILRFCPPQPSEKELMVRFARIGVGAGHAFDIGNLSAETQKALEAGMSDAWTAFAGLVARVSAGELTSADLFGTRADLKNNYLYRMGGAALGLYGNSAEEAIYPPYYVDATGQKLNGADSYTLRFAPGQLPPVHAFWSITMYEQPASLLVANPLNRYLLNSTMLPQFKRDPDGGLTFLIQNASPSKDMEANWLPAPTGPFSTIMRLYFPRAEALDGRWTAPPLKRAE